MSFRSCDSGELLVLGGRSGGGIFGQAANGCSPYTPYWGIWRVSEANMLTSGLRDITFSTRKVEMNPKSWKILITPGKDALTVSLRERILSLTGRLRI